MIRTKVTPTKNHIVEPEPGIFMLNAKIVWMIQNKIKADEKAMLEDVLAGYPTTKEEGFKAAGDYHLECETETFSLSRVDVDSSSHDFSLRYVSSTGDVYEYALSKGQVALFDYYEQMCKIYIVDLQKSSIDRRFTLIKVHDAMTAVIVDCGYLDEMPHTTFHRMSAASRTESRLFVSQAFLEAHGLQELEIDVSRPKGCCEYKIVGVVMSQNKVAVSIKDKNGDVTESPLSSDNFDSQCGGCLDSRPDVQRAFNRLNGKTTSEDGSGRVIGWLLFLAIVLLFIVMSAYVYRQR